MEHEIRARWLRFPSLLPAGPQMEPGNSSPLLPRPGVWVSFHYPLLGLCLFSDKEFSKNHLASAIFRSPALILNVQRSTFLSLFSLRGLFYFLLMDSFKWQISSCCQDFSINVVWGSWGAFELRGRVILRYRYTCVKVELHGQYLCWQDS